jgi:hypothetical protein
MWLRLFSWLLRFSSRVLLQPKDAFHQTTMPEQEKKTKQRKAAMFEFAMTAK